jgi:hypothetical protein
MRNDSTVYVGLDVHKESIVAAYAVDLEEMQDLGEVGFFSPIWIGCVGGCVARHRRCTSCTKRARAVMRCIDI